MSLTIEQQASYVANDICPNCGSDINALIWNVSGNMIGIITS